MSKLLELAYKEVDKSSFAYNNKGDIEVQSAFIFWKNFRGEKDAFGNATRKFTLAVPEDVATELINRGWKVDPKKINKDDPESETVYCVNVKVGMDSMYPPEVVLFSEFKGQKTRKILDETNVGVLDGAELLTVDIVLHEAHSKRFEGKVTGYLKKLYAIQSPEMDFNGKYDAWMDDEEVI